LITAIGRASTRRSTAPLAAVATSGCTCCVPNYNGVFLRGVNHGREDEYRDKGLSERIVLDPDGSEKDRVGSLQPGAYENHKHGDSFSIPTSGAHKHKIKNPGETGSVGSGAGAVAAVQQDGGTGHYAQTLTDLSGHSHTLNGSVSTSTTGSSETRRANAYVNWIIKF
jgi:hypothetical protein